MDSDEAHNALTEYRDKLNQRDWPWIIPRQDAIRTIVSGLVDRTFAWPVLGGSYWPSQHPTVQLQLIETALFNLESQPALAAAIGSKDRWAATADRLDEIADSMPAGDWIGLAAEAQQLVAVLNPDVARQIEDLVDKHSLLGEHDYPGARERVLGAIRGAAVRARLHGPGN